MRRQSWRTVGAAFVLALSLHLVWGFLVATSGGDLAAQDAWAAFARAHPTSAYNLSWYGGLHPISYSVLSPYVMAALGVRTTGVVFGVAASMALAVLLSRMPDVEKPFWPAVVGTIAIWGDTASGRITFSMGLAFALLTLDLLVRRPRLNVPSGAAVAILALLATASSGIAGLFLGVVGAGLWLTHRRGAAMAVGLPPALLVLITTLAFPFQGFQPYPWYLVLPAVVVTVIVWSTAPREWRWLRRGALMYVLGILAFWIVPTPVGSNMDRLAMILGPVVMLVVIQSGRPRHPMRRLHRTIPAWGLVWFGFIGAFGWNFVQAGLDISTNAYATVLDAEAKAVIAQLDSDHADLWRVEVVPSDTHRDASQFAPYVNLARGWNRQADTERNPIFYDTQSPLSLAEYRRWLARWAVGFVVVPPGTADYAAAREAILVRSDPGFLKRIWSGGGWEIYQVLHPTPLVAAPATVITFNSDRLTVSVPHAGRYMIRVDYSPWLGLVDQSGALVTQNGPGPGAAGCVEQVNSPAPDFHPSTLPRAAAFDHWTMLLALQPGIYRLSAPLALPRGTPCSR